MEAGKQTTPVPRKVQSPPVAGATAATQSAESKPSPDPVPKEDMAGAAAAATLEKPAASEPAKAAPVVDDSLARLTKHRFVKPIILDAFNEIKPMSFQHFQGLKEGFKGLIEVFYKVERSSPEHLIKISPNGDITPAPIWNLCGYHPRQFNEVDMSGTSRIDQQSDKLLAYMVHMLSAEKRWMATAITKAERLTTHARNPVEAIRFHIHEAKQRTSITQEAVWTRCARTFEDAAATLELAEQQRRLAHSRLLDAIQEYAEAYPESVDGGNDELRKLTRRYWLKPEKFPEDGATTQFVAAAMIQFADIVAKDPRKRQHADEQSWDEYVGDFKVYLQEKSDQLWDTLNPRAETEDRDVGDDRPDSPSQDPPTPPPPHKDSREGGICGGHASLSDIIKSGTCHLWVGHRLLRRKFCQVDWMQISRQSPVPGQRQYSAVCEEP
jgi:hypothetical protein